MTGYLKWAFPFPDDNEAALEHIMVLMVQGDRRVMSLTSPIAYVLRVAAPPTLIYLQCAGVAEPLDDDDGNRILQPHELVVRAADREECERLLREECPSEVIWFRLVHVSAKTAKDMAAFRAAYDSVASWNEDI